MRIVVSLDMPTDISSDFNIQVISEELKDAVVEHFDIIIKEFRAKNGDILKGNLGDDNKKWAKTVINNLKIARDSTHARVWGFDIKSDDAE